MAPVRHPQTLNKALVVQWLAVGLILLIIYILWRRNQPEYLQDMNAGSYFELISDGMLYQTFNGDPRGQTRSDVVSRPPAGGPARTLVEEDAHWSFSAYSTPHLSLADGQLYYALSPYQKPVSFGGFMPRGLVSLGGSMPRGPAVVRRRFLGAFALAPVRLAAPPTSGEKRTAEAEPIGAITVRFRAVPLRGGAARDCAKLHLHGSAALVGSHVFWMRGTPGSHVRVIRGSEEWLEMPCTGDLMLTDLKNGSERCIGHGYANDSFNVGENGVFFSNPLPYPDSRRDLFYASAVNGRVLHLGPEAAEAGVPGRSVECQGALYWLARREILDEPDTGALMMADLKEGHVRPVIALDNLNRYALPETNLKVRHNALYCLVTDAKPGVPTHLQQRCLARLRPSRREQLEILRRLPAQTRACYFDQGFLYYIVSEHRRGLAEILTDDTAAGQTIPTLYRVPLPE